MSTQLLLDTNQDKSPTKLHYLALLSVAFGKFGESVEFMLPAVITQPVSCDLALSDKQEHVLALVQYASASIVSLLTIPFLQQYPRRPIILFALYLAVISAVLCAIVPNYISLLLSRILVGVTIAVGTTPLSVYLSEISPNRQFYLVGTVISTVGWTVGGGWCGTLGYMFLEKIGWRWFVLLTSVPLFIPSIIAFQFFLPESLSTVNDMDQPSGSVSESLKTPKKAMIWRMVKLSLINTFRGFPYYGSILLLPAIFKEDNAKNDRGGSFCNAIHGTQFLVVTLMFGGCHLLGKVMGYITHKLQIPSGILFFILSIVTMASLIMMQEYHDNTTILIASLCVVQVALPLFAVELGLLTFDATFFTKTFLPISSGLFMAIEFLNGILANAVAELFLYTVVLKVFTAMSAGMLLSSILFFKNEDGGR